MEKEKHLAMSTGSTLKKFNPIDMSKEDVIALATGREKILATMLDEMKSYVNSQISQHYVLFGPRGIGKSFFIRLLNIHHDKSEEFAESIFIQLPEETDNIRYVADLMDKISNKLEGGYYIDTRPRWEMTDYMWSESKKRLTAALKKIEKEDKQHVFIGIENLQDFIPTLDEVENGRMREFLSDFHKITLIGSSLRPDLDNDYNKKLFQVFKKIDIEPWKADDYIEFYQKKASLSPNQKEQQSQLDISENKIKAIAAFTGGSPRLAVILSSLVLDQKIVETAVLLDNIIDDLTAYYQDLIKDIPPKSKALFDMLIRIGENVTQSELAKSFDPPLEQRTIARSFNWLLDNYYVVFKKQAKGNTKNYFVRDRLFVLYYQKRQVFADQLTSFVGIFVDFLTEYFSIVEWKEQIQAMDLSHPYSKSIMLCYSSSRGLELDVTSETKHIQSNILSDIESKYSKATQKTKSSLDIEGHESKNNDYINLGVGLKESGDIDRVIIHLKKAIKLNPNNAEAYNYLGIVLNQEGDLEGAKEQYEKAIELNPKYAGALHNLGNTLIGQGDLVGARKQYEKAIEFNPALAIAYNNLGTTFRGKENLEGGIAHFKKAIELNPRLAIAYYNLGISLKDQGDLEGGIAQYKKAIELNPKYATAYYNLGNALSDQGDLEGGIAQYKKAIELNPKYADAYNNLGNALSDQGDLEGGITQYKKAIKVNPKFADAYNNLGNALTDQGDLEGGIAQYKRAIELNPKAAAAYNNLGVQFYKLERWKESEIWILKGLEKINGDLNLLHGLFELYLIQYKWKEISEFRKKLSFGLSKDKMIGRALGEAMNHEKVESFLLFKETLNFIQTSHPEWLIGFIISLTMHLFTSNKKELLETLVDELKQEESDNPFIAIILECWEYLQDPDSNDIAKLHPDARIVANKIMELENMEKA